MTTKLDIVNKWIATQDLTFIAMMIKYIYQIQESTLPSTFYTDAVMKISSVNWWKALKFYGREECHLG